MTTTQLVNRYYIRAKYFYYPGTLNAPQDGSLCNHGGDKLKFDSPAAACEFLRTVMGCKKTTAGKHEFDGTYVCRHGEYSRPVFAIRKMTRSTISAEEVA